MNLPPEPSAAPADPQVGSLPADATADALADAAAQAVERRRRLTEQIVAGMLPETTSDERPSGTADSGFSEQWYRDNRPPHHGG